MTTTTTTYPPWTVCCRFGQICADYEIFARTEEQAQAAARKLFAEEFGLTSGQAGFVEAAV